MAAADDADPDAVATRPVTKTRARAARTAAAQVADEAQPAAARRRRDGAHARAAYGIRMSPPPRWIRPVSGRVQRSY